MAALRDTLARRRQRLDAILRSGDLTHPALRRAARFARQRDTDSLLTLPNPEAGLDPDRVDEKKATAVFTVSTVTQDRSGDVVVPDGCRAYLDGFKNNPIVSFNHLTHEVELPIATAGPPDGPLSWDILPDRILSEAHFHLKTELSEQCFELVAMKVLKGASLGFIPHLGERISFSEPDAMGRDDVSFDFPGFRFTAWEPVEWGVVVIPCNAQTVSMVLGRNRLAGRPIAAPLAKGLGPYRLKRRLWDTKGSYFGECPRDEEGHCKPSGQGGESESGGKSPIPADVPADDPVHSYAEAFTGEPVDEDNLNAALEANADLEGESSDYRIVPGKGSWEAASLEDLEHEYGSEWMIGMDPLTDTPAVADTYWFNEREGLAGDKPFQSYVPAFNVDPLDVSVEELQTANEELESDGSEYRLHYDEEQSLWVAQPEDEYDPEEEESRLSRRGKKTTGRLYQKEGNAMIRKWVKPSRRIKQGAATVKLSEKDAPDFDISAQDLRPSTVVYDFVARHLGVPIKEVYESGTHVPAAKLGGFLSAWEEETAPFNKTDVRNINGSGSESPPRYEVIRLNSEKTRDFLVDGLIFLEGPFRAVAELSKSWYGLGLTLYTRQDERQRGLDLLDKTWTATRERHNYLKGEAFALSGEFLPKTDETWSDIFLPEKITRQLSLTLKQLNDRQEKFANRGTIFMGVPGTGKTLSGRVIRNEVDATFVWISAMDFYRSGAFGGFSYAFELARELSPTVLFFEDVDHWLDSYSVDLLKTEMDGIGRYKGVWTILTTNFPERLPEALIDRPGRFHDVLNFGLPDEAIRKAMVGKWLPELTGTDLAAAVKGTDGYSGAHVYELCHFARVLHEEECKDFPTAVLLALEKIREQRRLIAQASGGSGLRRRTLPDQVASYSKGRTWRVVKGQGAISKGTTANENEEDGMAIKRLAELVHKQDQPAGAPAAGQSDQQPVAGEAIQAVLCPKATYATAEEAATYVGQQGLDPSDMEDAGDAWAFIQFEPDQCTPETARREQLDDGCEVVYCARAAAGEQEGTTAPAASNGEVKNVAAKNGTCARCADKGALIDEGAAAFIQALRDLLPPKIKAEVDRLVSAKRVQAAKGYTGLTVVEHEALACSACGNDQKTLACLKDLGEAAAAAGGNLTDKPGAGQDGTQQDGGKGPPSLKMFHAVKDVLDEHGPQQEPDSAAKKYHEKAYSHLQKSATSMHPDHDFGFTKDMPQADDSDEDDSRGGDDDEDNEREEKELAALGATLTKLDEAFNHTGTQFFRLTGKRI